MLTDAERRVIELYVGNYRNDPVKDLHAVYSALVRKGEWEKFLAFAYEYPGTVGLSIDNSESCESRQLMYDDFFISWLFCLDHPEQIKERMKMVCEFIEGRK